jgi:arabinan endo-1,5-alpha-L-arabinosidase
MRRCLWMSLVLAGLAQAGSAEAEKALVEAGKFTEVFDPQAGERDPWCINDHAIIRGPDGTWHVFGITHIILPVDFFRDPGKNLLHATARTNLLEAW